MNSGVRWPHTSNDVWGKTYIGQNIPALEDFWFTPGCHKDHFQKCHSFFPIDIVLILAQQVNYKIMHNLRCLLPRDGLGKGGEEKGNSKKEEVERKNKRQRKQEGMENTGWTLVANIYRNPDWWQHVERWVPSLCVSWGWPSYCISRPHQTFDTSWSAHILWAKC